MLLSPSPGAVQRPSCHGGAALPTLPDTAAALAPKLPADDVFYPCSDGRPMADNMWQAEAMFGASGDIKTAHSNALVATDILVYPEQGNPRNNIAPDVLVAFGLGTHKRSSYFVWKEGKPPDWLLEVASPSTAAKDLEEKRCKYAEMGVPEYWLFDPQGDVFRRRGEPQLQGFRLVDGEYKPLDTVRKNGRTMIRSDVLGLDLRTEGELIRFHDPAAGRDIRHRDETEAIVERAVADRRAAQARVAELEAALQALRAGSDDEASPQEPSAGKR